MRVFVPERDRKATIMYGSVERATRVWVTYEDGTREPVKIATMLSGAVVAETMETMTEFRPGDVIVGATKASRYTVLDPVRTSRGKVRTANKNGGLTTFWWVAREDLPPRHALEKRA